MLELKPRLRGSFSDRNKIVEINKIIQKDNLDERTRNKIINIFDSITSYYGSRGYTDEFYNYIYKEIFCFTKDEIPSYSSERREKIVSAIKNRWEYYDIFSFIEGILDWTPSEYKVKLTDRFNKLFEEECVGYRFVNGQIIDIIDEEEIKEIEEALNSKYITCKQCIDKSLKLLYDREQPDYANSVKESISAIESMCNIILETKNKTLGDALNELEKSGFKIHGAMKKAFSALYGYTSDKSGIRHNLGIDENTTFEEAKFMLVSCSAFLNYLIGIYEK